VKVELVDYWPDCNVVGCNGEAHAEYAVDRSGSRARLCGEHVHLGNKVVVVFVVVTKGK
jgi:hypothetical protein